MDQSPWNILLVRRHINVHQNIYSSSLCNSNHQLREIKIFFGPLRSVHHWPIAKILKQGSFSGHEQSVQWKADQLMKSSTSLPNIACQMQSLLVYPSSLLNSLLKPPSGHGEFPQSWNTTSRSLPEAAGLLLDVVSNPHPPKLGSFCPTPSCGHHSNFPLSNQNCGEVKIAQQSDGYPAAQLRKKTWTRLKNSLTSQSWIEYPVAWKFESNLGIVSQVKAEFFYSLMDLLVEVRSHDKKILQPFYHRLVW